MRKIYFDNVNFSSRTGPNAFIGRLAQQISRLGFEITEGADCDIALVLVERSSNFPAGKPFVQRLDGVWSKPQEIQWANNGIISFYLDASGVVFQSFHNLRQVTSWFGWPPGRVTVINNGADTEEPVQIPGELSELRRNFEKIFVCAADWHGQKRLKENIELFEHIRRKQFPGSVLLILGDHPDHVVEDPAILYLGNLDHDTCKAIYHIADWMIHLCWSDSCPNVVAEALAQGTPVICTDVGGTKELVGRSGYVIREQTPYDFMPSDYHRHPQLQSLENFVLPDDVVVDRDRMLMSRVAEKYATYLEACYLDATRGTV